MESAGVVDMREIELVQDTGVVRCEGVERVKVDYGFRVTHWYLVEIHDVLITEKATI